MRRLIALFAVFLLTGVPALAQSSSGFGWQGRTSGGGGGLTSPVGIVDGGTGQTSKANAFNALSPLTTLGDLLYGGASGAGTRLAGNTSTTRKYLGETGDGTNAAAPTFTQVNFSELAGTCNLLTQVANALPLANGGTGQTTKSAAFDALSPMTTSGDIIYGGASGTGTRLAKGSDGQYLKLVSGLPAWAAGAAGGSGFGGDGSDSAVTKGAVTETTIAQYNATTFTQTVSTTYVPISGTQINANSTITLNGTTNVATGAPGGVANAGTGNSGIGTYGRGPSPGDLGATGTVGAGGGAGGGFGGAGGDGGILSPNTAAVGGVAVPLAYSMSGSGGQSGTSNAGLGGNGGAGGGYIRLCAVGAITIASGGSINAIGGNGANSAGGGNGGGGGGGSGGGIYEYSQTSITQTGTASVAGGNGGNAQAGAYGGGGGGGGGYYLRHSPSNTGAGTITVSGGTKGSNGSGGSGGSNGSSGVAIAITGTPNLPLIAEHEKNINAMVALAKAQQMIGRQGSEVRWTQKENVGYLAALKGSEGFDSLCYELDNGEWLDGSGKVAQLEGVGDAVALDNAA